MIKSIPGWANYVILWGLYFIIAFLLSLAFDGWRLALVISTVYAGGYLAKWRFYDEGWHFW